MQTSIEMDSFPVKKLDETLALANNFISVFTKDHDKRTQGTRFLTQRNCEIIYIFNPLSFGVMCYAVNVIAIDI